MHQPSSCRRTLAAGLLTAAAALTVPATVAAAGVRAHHHAGSRDRKAGAVVHLMASKKFGHILVTASGRTLYTLVSGAGSPLPCSGTCASLWPPLTTSGKPHGVKGLEGRLLGTKKAGGKTQITYDGHPLYLYAGDSGKGQVNGEGVKSFGGVWYVISTKGSPVHGTLVASGGNGGGSYGGGSGGSGGGW
jgi:predicted lipoprotein with Yx(FWY)xxD motif